MTGVRTIAIVSALADELRPLAGRLAGTERCRVGGVEARRGRLAGRDVCLAITGEGRHRAAAALEPLLADRSIVALLGVGIAGGLTDDLEAGDLVLGRQVVDSAGGTLQPPEWEWSEPARQMEGVAGGTVVTMNSIAQAPADKRGLAARLGLDVCSVVDLESSAWAGAAAGRGLPWLVLRSVSDTSSEKLPLDFERFRGAGGEVSRGRVLRHALLRPRLLFDLARLRRRVASCAEALANATEALLAW